VIGFNDLYSEDRDAALAALLLFFEDFGEGYGCKIHAKTDKLARYIKEIPLGDEFPANGGLPCASPFKKAAYLYVLLHERNPFHSAIPAESQDNASDPLDPDDLTVTTIAIALVQACLEGASYVKGETDCTLRNPIDFSEHFFYDLVEASRSITVDNHFRSYSLIFETLAYRANTQAPKAASKKSKGVTVEDAEPEEVAGTSDSCSYEGAFTSVTAATYTAATIETMGIDP